MDLLVVMRNSWAFCDKDCHQLLVYSMPRTSHSLLWIFLYLIYLFLFIEQATLQPWLNFFKLQENLPWV